VKDDRLYLVHIADRLERIADYTEGGRDAFMRSPVVQDAVMRNLEVVGEAAKRVSEAVRAVSEAAAAEGHTREAWAPATRPASVLL